MTLRVHKLCQGIPKRHMTVVSSPSLVFSLPQIDLKEHKDHLQQLKLYNFQLLIIFLTFLWIFLSLKKNGGEQGIRTLEGVAPLHAFQACVFDHSTNSPHNSFYHLVYHFVYNFHFLQALRLCLKKLEMSLEHSKCLKPPQIPNL